MAVRFAILDASEISSINYSEVKTKSEEHLRYNLDRTKVLVKFTQDDVPSFLSSKKIYSKDQIAVIVNDYDEGWNEQAPQ